MKLLSVYIDKYKNLSGNYDFTSQDGYIALIGENGSGKSNLLEAISLIFGKLYKISNIEDIGKFRICYEIDGAEHSYGNIDAERNDIELEANPRLPSSIISCYSGEDMRLWHMVYENYYMQYFKKALRDKTFSPKIMYINKYCWKIAFIALLCSDKDEVKSFLKDCCHYNDITEISIKFAVDPAKRAMFVDHSACRWYDAISQNVDENGEINANIFASTDMTTYGAPDQYAPNYVFQFLYLLSLPEKNKAKKQTIDKLINNISININGVDFGDLSEGEKKMILIECITQILGDENSLVLLDEPDAHTHIARKKELLEVIETFEGQTILTTHSPVFVNDIYKHHKDCLFHIENGKIITSQYINALTKLSAGEIDYINGTIVLSSKRLLITEGPYDKRYLEKALDIFCNKDEKYKVLRQVAIIPSNSASNADTFYRQVIEPQLDKYEQIVFMFDYDKEGVNGWNGITKIRDPKTKAIFYQSDYSEIKDTNVKNVNAEATFMVEDLFSPNAYKEKVEYIHRKHSHKDFRCNDQGKTTEAIKKHIENYYSSFEDDWFDGYKNVLNKLIDIFNL